MNTELVYFWYAIKWNAVYYFRTTIIDTFHNQFRMGLCFRPDGGKGSITKRPMFGAKMPIESSVFVQTAFPVVGVNLNRMWPFYRVLPLSDIDKSRSL